MRNSLQAQAVQTVENFKKYLHSTGNDAYGSAYKAGKQVHSRVKSQYPKLVAWGNAASDRAAQLGSVASSRAAQMKDALAQAGQEAYSAGKSVRYSTRKAGLLAIKLSAVYALLKLYSGSKAEVTEVSQKVKEHIQSKPVQSTFVALGIGYMLAKIMR